jgi:uncharacterized protein
MDENKKEKIKKECIDLLKKAGCNERVIRHCLVVAEVALEIAKGKKVSEELILKGALLHDIGRSSSNGIDHGYIGGEIAKKFGVEDKVVRIIQRHLGAGLTAEEAKKYGMPEIDLIPETREEKIVAYADKLVDNDKIVSIEETIKQYEKKLGKNYPAIERLKKLHEEVVGEKIPEDLLK